MGFVPSRVTLTALGGEQKQEQVWRGYCKDRAQNHGGLTGVPTQGGTPKNCAGEPGSPLPGS